MNGWMDGCIDWFHSCSTGGRFIGVPKNKWERQRLARGRGPYRRDRQRTDRQASVQVLPEWKVGCSSSLLSCKKNYTSSEPNPPSFPCQPDPWNGPMEWNGFCVVHLLGWFLFFIFFPVGRWNGGGRAISCPPPSYGLLLSSSVVLGVDTLAVVLDTLVVFPLPHTVDQVGEKSGIPLAERFSGRVVLCTAVQCCWAGLRLGGADATLPFCRVLNTDTVAFGYGTMVHSIPRWAVLPYFLPLSRRWWKSSSCRS